MCIFAKFARISNSKSNPGKGVWKSHCELIFGRCDMINIISVIFALIAFVILIGGLKFAQPQNLSSVVVDSYSEWLGILVDAMLLYSINWAIRREERRRLVNQFGSESNAFALDATKQIRKKGWLMDGRLSGIELTHAQLSKANLSKSILQDVDFSYADMKEASLVEADLSGSNLTGADLQNSECRWADFRHANLRWANLEGAILDGAKFEGADLRFAKLGNINKSTVSLEGALLSQNLTDEEVALVQNSTKMLRKSIDEFSLSFYRELFRVNPLVQSLFISDIKDQAKKFAQLFEILVTSLNKVEKLLPALKALGRRHVNYGIEEYHYGIVGTALINTLKKSLGHNFTPEIEDAWIKTYGLVSMIMIDSGKGLL